MTEPATVQQASSPEAAPAARALALLVIDPVNDFLSEGGAAWELTKATVEMNDVVGNLKRLIEGCRLAEVPVIFGPMAYTREDYAGAGLQTRSGINRIMYERKMFLAGTWGADFHPELRPSDGEVVLQPHKGTDVFQTDLPEQLRRLGTRHLVIAGMTANLCCESTGRHAAELGYDVTFVTDAIGAENLPAYEASIRINYPLVANAVLKVDEFLASLQAAGMVEEGDTVYGSDHGEVGRVERVVTGDADLADHIIVPRGRIIEHEVYVPLDAIVRRLAGAVVVNVPKLVIGKMPWNDPPRRSQVEEKRGPKAAAVERIYGSAGPTNRGNER